MSYSWWSWKKRWWNSSDWTGWQQSQYKNYNDSRWYYNQYQHQSRPEPAGKFLGWRKRTYRCDSVYCETKRLRFADSPIANDLYESTNSEYNGSKSIEQAKIEHDGMVSDSDKESYSEELVIDEVSQMIQPSIDMLKKRAFRLKEKVNTTHFAVMSPPLDLLLTDPNSEYNGSKDIEQAKIEHDGMVTDSDQESYSEELVIEQVSQMIEPNIEMLKKKHFD